MLTHNGCGEELNIMDRKKETILKATAALTENYKNEELFMPKNDRSSKGTEIYYISGIFLE